MLETKHDYYRENIPDKRYILCKETAAEYLNLSNGSLVDFTIRYYTEADGIDFIEFNGLRCTSINQTINDLLADENSDEQVILESLSNYYYKHEESFEGLTIYEHNKERFTDFAEDAKHYYDE